MHFSRQLAAEFFGTFVLIFAGTGAIIINAETGALTHLGVAAAFGLVIMCLIHVLGDVSGCHLNPAVTLAFAGAGRFSWKQVPGFVLAQIMGGLCASLVLSVLFSEELRSSTGAAAYGGTVPRGPAMQSFWLEIFLTWFLMLAILNVSCGAREKGITAAIAIGGVIGLEALFAGPISGASMNPARSLAPALVSGDLKQVWIYLTAPIIGALLAIPTFWLLRGRQCCRPQVDDTFPN